MRRTTATAIQSPPQGAQGVGDPPVSPPGAGGAHRLAAALLGIALAVAACGGDDTSGDGLFDDSVDAEAGLLPPAAEADRGDAVDEMTEEASAVLEPTDEAGGLFPDEAQLEPARPDTRFRSFVSAAVDPLSTFALDVDTGSYTLARRAITEGQMPASDTVRPEEFLNAFDYGYADPGDELGIFLDGGPSPFDPDNVLVRVGVQAERIDADDRPDAHLTFVVDTSGSMGAPHRLPVVKDALTTLTENLGPGDSVALVTYGSEARILLEPTSISDAEEILNAIDDLGTDGSTNLDAGLRTAYDLARHTLEEGHRGDIHRVIVASDGIANVGLTDPDGLSDMIRVDADAGIQLVTVGVGIDGFNDTLMEQLADQGDGFYAYVDTQDEAERLFQTDLVGTLFTLAIDAKIQVEFDPDTVQNYRLIGFENRAVADRDFRNDAVDAGEIGAGHTVTALYEIEPTGRTGDLGEVRLRWERPEGGEVVEIDRRIADNWISERFTDTDPGFQLATTVAVWAEILRGNPAANGLSLQQVAEEAERLHGELDTEETAELVDLTAWTAREG